MQKMYNELASWWPLLSPVTDYADEAAFYQSVFSQYGVSSKGSLLELGCGGGSNAFYLKEPFSHLTLTDLSPHMLAMSQQLNPTCEHVQGDMRTLRLDRLFGAVFIHDAIDYMTTEDDLRKAIETAFVHCKAGGVALFAPDHVREVFMPATEHGGSEEGDRALRYLEWTYDPDAQDTTYTVEYVYVLRQAQQAVQVLHEQHICGLFSRATWLNLLREVGFQAESISDSYERDLFIGVK